MSGNLPLHKLQGYFHMQNVIPAIFYVIITLSH